MTSGATAGLGSASGEVSESPQPPVPKGKEGEEEDKEEEEEGEGEEEEEGEEGEDEGEDEGEEEEGEIDPRAPPLPKETAPSGPPLPAEPVPEPVDDGWDCQWDPSTQAWFFYNRYTGKTQWDNPRLSDTSPAVAPGTTPVPRPPIAEQPVISGYNPAIHGDYDPNAWYAKGYANEQEGEAAGLGAGSAEAYSAMAQFNRFTGQFQSEGVDPSRHGDEAKSRRQMNAFFDVDAAANAHDGRSLKAERSNKRVSKTELKQFKEKRRARKEEKRRAWLRD